MSEQWILVGKYLDTGLPKYHAADTAIGPKSTPDIAEAWRFESREEACQSIGFRHWSSNLKPVPLSDALAKAQAQ